MYTLCSAHSVGPLTCFVWNSEHTVIISLYSVKVLHSVKDERNILHTVKSKVTGLVTSCVGTALLNTLLKERQREGHK